MLNDIRNKIPDFDRCYTLVVQNANPFPVPITIFGAKQFLTAVNFGLPAGVTVNVLESSYQELLEETMYQPFIVGAVTIDSSLPQLAQIMRATYRDTNGVIQQYVFKTSSYFSIFQYQDILEIYPLDLYVSDEYQSQFTILGNTTSTITFYVIKRVNVANALHNRAIIEKGSELYPFFKSEIELSLPKQTTRLDKDGNEAK